MRVLFDDRAGSGLAPFLLALPGSELFRRAVHPPYAAGTQPMDGGCPPNVVCRRSCYAWRLPRVLCRRRRRSPGRRLAHLRLRILGFRGCWRRSTTIIIIIIIIRRLVDRLAEDDGAEDAERRLGPLSHLLLFLPGQIGKASVR